jgi:hypothetical protein
VPPWGRGAGPGTPGGRSQNPKILSDDVVEGVEVGLDMPGTADQEMQASENSSMNIIINSYDMRGEDGRDSDRRDR